MKIFTILVFSLAAIFHPIHVSVLNIEYSKTNDNFDVLLKVFTDDFDSLLTLKYGVDLNLGTETEHDDAPYYLKKYIHESISIQCNSKNGIEFEYAKKEHDFEATWLYFTFECTSPVTSFMVENRVMLELFEDQTNLVIVKYLTDERGFQLNNHHFKINIDY